MNLFGLGTLSKSRAITAQRRINCYVEPRKEQDRTAFALVGRPGLKPFVTTIGGAPSRGKWAVNTLSTPLLFTVHGGTLYSINNAGVTMIVGTIGTTTGDVSFADDGTYLVLVDGTNGYVYNMLTAVMTQISDGNFTTSPKTVTWQDGYFIVTSGDSKQFQLSQISPGVDPLVWPAVQINFTGSGAGSLKSGISDHSILHLFGDIYTEFWQNAGNPDFPFAKITGSAQEFGLKAAFSLSKFDNSVVGLFQNSLGGLNVSRMKGFSLDKLSDQDIEDLLVSYQDTSNAKGYGFMVGGHPLYVLNLTEATWVYDGLPNAWTEWSDLNGDRFWGDKFAKFVNRLLVSDYRNGNIYEIDSETYTDNGDVIPFEVWSKHIWSDDKYLGINQIQVDVESGVGSLSETDPVIDLQVSKDGGNTFNSVGFSQMGAIGEYTQRVIWNSLGASRDWVLKLRVTDSVKRVITGASAYITGGSFGT